MRYINLRFTYLLTYLLPSPRSMKAVQMDQNDYGGKDL